MAREEEALVKVRALRGVCIGVKKYLRGPVIERDDKEQPKLDDNGQPIVKVVGEVGELSNQNRDVDFLVSIGAVERVDDERPARRKAA